MTIDAARSLDIRKRARVFQIKCQKYVDTTTFFVGAGRNIQTPLFTTDAINTTNTILGRPLTAQIGSKADLRSYLYNSYNVTQGTDSRLTTKGFRATVSGIQLVPMRFDLSFKIESISTDTSNRYYVDPNYSQRSFQQIGWNTNQYFQSGDRIPTTEPEVINTIYYTGFSNEISSSISYFARALNRYPPYDDYGFELFFNYGGLRFDALVERGNRSNGNVIYFLTHFSYNRVDHISPDSLTRTGSGDLGTASYSLRFHYEYESVLTPVYNYASVSESVGGF